MDQDLVLKWKEIRAAQRESLKEYNAIPWYRFIYKARYARDYRWLVERANNLAAMAWELQILEGEMEIDWDHARVLEPEDKCPEERPFPSA